ncbi:MAG: hypothetical protein KKH11_02245 [Candidatus Omnitrophica bacterium]|nr:hypothetical protein [Candidatus Omnitrophota bacterium]
MWQIIKDIGLWIKSLFFSHARIRSLEKENIELKQKISEHDKQKPKFQEEITSLQEQISKQSRIDSLLDGLTFDTKIGLYQDPSGILFCHKCLHTRKEKTPVVETHYGWLCNTCDKPYYKHNSDLPREADMNHDYFGLDC